MCATDRISANFARIQDERSSAKRALRYRSGHHRRGTSNGKPASVVHGHSPAIFGVRSLQLDEGVPRAADRYSIR